MEVTRQPGPQLPQHYPLFLRAEDACAGPVTDLLTSQAALKEALNRFAADRKPMKRVISVRFTSDRDEQGFFRKYGAFVIGDRIVPIHVMRSKNWVVKNSERDDDAAFIDEERAYCEDNPHEDWLRKVAQVGGIRYGRIDYGFFEGKLVVFEVNLNPTFPDVDPQRKQGGREKRKSAFVPQMADALASIDPGAEASKGEVSFKLKSVSGARYIEREAWYQDLPYRIAQRKKWRGAYLRLRRKLVGS